MGSQDAPATPNYVGKFRAGILDGLMGATSSVGAASALDKDASAQDILEYLQVSPDL